MRFPLLVFLLATCPLAKSDIVLSTRNSQIVAGAPLMLELTITNEKSEPFVLELPPEVHVRCETANSVATLEFHPDRNGTVEVAPNGFARVLLSGAMPEGARDVAIFVPTGIASNSVGVQVVPRAASERSVVKSATAPASTQIESRLIDRPPPLPVSVYEPIYFIAGGDGGLNAKFEVSLRYRLFDGEGPLARRLPWIDDLYLSFSQTSLWDLGDLSKPFRDSSYRPRLFFSNYDLVRKFDGRLRLGFEAGAGHESNGKDGADSRSFNMLYVRPTLTLGDPDGFRLYAGPLIHNYIDDDENPDIENYRGYIDWLVGAGAKGGLDFWAVLRKGSQSDFGSAELNLSYPLAKLSDGSLTGWLMLQYFGGYGESLLDYKKKLDSQIRLGIAIAL